MFVDNVDTAGALKTVRDFVSVCNLYLGDKSPEFAPNALLLKNIASYCMWLLRIFGALPSDSSIGFPLGSTDNSGFDVSYVGIISGYV